MRKYLLYLAFASLLFTACASDEESTGNIPIPPDTTTDDESAGNENDDENENDENNDESDGATLYSVYTYTPNNNPDAFEVIEELTDEFADGYDSSKWEAIGSSSATSFPTWDYKAENIAAADGVVNLTIKYDPRTNRSNGNSSFTYADDIYFSSGMLRSWTYTTYGYYEARIKGASLHPTIDGRDAEETKNMGSCASFWLYTDVSTGKANIPAATNEHGVYYNEIDIIELNQVAYEPHTLSQNLHLMTWEDGAAYFASADKHPVMGLSETVNSGWDTAEDYHIYACENRPDSLIMYVDHVRVSAKPNYFWHLDEEVGGGMRVTLGLGLRNPFEKYISGVRTAIETSEAEATAAGFPSSSSVDYVRSWRRKDYTDFPSSQRAWEGKDVEL